MDKLVAEYGGPRTADGMELVEALRQCDERYRQLSAELNEQGLSDTCYGLIVALSLVNTYTMSGKKVTLFLTTTLAFLGRFL